MNILMIDVNCRNTSTGKIVYDLYSEVNKKGHTAAVCYGRGPVISEKNILKFGINPETYFHALMTRITGYTGIYSPFSTYRLLHFMKKFKPDVVHIHELHGYFVNIAPVINYLKKHNIKTIWTFHCEFMYTGKCGYAYECNQWKTECKQCPQLGEYPATYFFDFTNKMFHNKKRLMNNFENLTIVTPSYWLAERVRQSFLQDKPVKMIRNGINTEEVFFQRESEHLRLKHNLKDEKIVLAVAPDIMSERKGGRWVVELAKRFKEKNVKFILIGVEDLTHEFDDNIIALGRTSNQIELAEYYSMADLFIICSNKENFPTTCIEALSCGTPVIGFDEGGTRETAPDGYGVFVPYGEIGQMEKSLDALLISKTVSLKSKDECELYGKTNYSKVKMCQEYGRLYDSILMND